MDKLGKWAKGKPEFFINAMICLADLSNSIFEVSKEDYFKSLRKLGITNIPEIAIWLDYYREKKLTEKEWNEIINKQGEMYKILFRLLIEFAKEAEAQIEEFAEQLKYISETLYELLKAELNSENELTVKDFRKSKVNHELVDINNNPGILFFVRVTMPCHFLYGELPSELYKKARGGDLKSFCKLLRIDKTIICDQNLAEYIKQMDIYRTSQQSNEIIKAFSGTYRKMTKSQVKSKMAGYISETSKGLGYKLTSEDIKTIFDDAARVFHGEDIDKDMMVSPQAITKIKQRYSKFWKFLN